ncbi:MAG: hypothetical protein WCK49_03790 [Myxococcaceae bacterium]
MPESLSVSPRSVQTRLANTLEIFNSNFVPAFDVSLSNFLKEQKLDFLESIYKGKNKSLKLTERVIPAGDRSLLKNEIRKKCDELYRKAHKNVIWVETTGLVDLSHTSKKSIPLGVYATGQSGLGFSGQLRLRRLEPYDSPSGSLPRGVSAGHAMQIPCTAALAKIMPAGSEFEFSGEGGFTLNFDITAELKATGKKIISIITQKLPQTDKIVVKLINSSGLERGLGYKYRYDPKWIFGAIAEYLLDNFGFMRWTHPTAANLEAKQQKNKSLIHQYVLDLSVPDQAKAYEDLFMRFSTKKAEEFAQKETGKESEVSYDINASASIGDTPLTLYHVSESEKTTESSSVDYKETKSIYEHISKWCSKLSVAWELISFKDKQKEFSQSYCHLTFNSPYASDFFELIDSLGISVLKEARDILSANPKTEIHADIFFTDAGIKNIQKSTPEQAFEAYSGLILTPEAKRYGEIQNKWFFTRCFFIFESKRLEQQTPWFKEKSSVIAHAFAFSKKTLPFQGSLKRFSDMKSIVSLMKLADPIEMIIHELSITGPGLSVFNPDEGQMIHPEQEITGRLAALA